MTVQQLEFKWSELAPEIFFANQLNCTLGFTFGPRIIGDYQFIFVGSGKGQATIQNTSYEAKKGDLFYYGPDVVHTFTADVVDPFVLYGVHFSWEGTPQKETYWAKIADVPPGAELPVVTNSCLVGSSSSPAQSLLLGDKRELPSEQFEPRFSKLANAFAAAQPYTPILLSAIMAELIVAIKQAEQNLQSFRDISNPVVQHVARQLEALACARYDRIWLERWTAYHPDYVARLFRKHTGLTPYDYFMSCKLQKAKQLLMQTNDTLLSIASQLEAGSIHTFSKWFKQASGYPPGKFHSRSRSDLI